MPSGVTSQRYERQAKRHHEFCTPLAQASMRSSAARRDLEAPTVFLACGRDRCMLDSSADRETKPFGGTRGSRGRRAGQLCRVTERQRKCCKLMPSQTQMWSIHLADAWSFGGCCLVQCGNQAFSANRPLILPRGSWPTSTIAGLGSGGADSTGFSKRTAPSDARVVDLTRRVSSSLESGVRAACGSRTTAAQDRKAVGASTARRRAGREPPAGILMSRKLGGSRSPNEQ